MIANDEGTAYTQLITNLRNLKLTQMVEHLDEVIDFCMSNKLSFTEALIKLTTYEIDSKETNAIRAMVKVGAFLFIKEIKDFDFSFQPSINEQQIRELASLRFLDKHENIIFYGPSGVGKTTLATAIGIAAAKKRRSTYFIKCHDLIAQLKSAQQENRLEVRLKHFLKYQCLIIDEIGYIVFSAEDANLLFQLIDKRYEKKSTIVTTNINFNKWDKVFKDVVLSNALLDRLHHSHIIPINGHSYRLKDVEVFED